MLQRATARPRLQDGREKLCLAKRFEVELTRCRGNLWLVLVVAHEDATIVLFPV